MKISRTAHPLPGGFRRRARVVHGALRLGAHEVVVSILGHECLCIRTSPTADVPGFSLYFPSRSQVSPAFRAFVDAAREVAAGGRQRARYQPCGRSLRREARWRTSGKHAT